MLQEVAKPRTTEANVALLRSAYRAWSESGGKATSCWLALLDDDVCYSSVGEGKGRPDYFKAKNGKERFKELFAGVATDWTMVQYIVSEFVAQGDVVVMRGFCAWTYRKTGKTIVTPKIDFWRFRDGKIVEFFDMFDTAAMLDTMR